MIMGVTFEESFYLADYVKARTLAKVNETQKKVSPPDTFYVRHGKRILDVLISLAAIIVTFPLNLVIGIITYFDVGRPIFFVQERPGKDGKLFKLVKFRNMRDAVDKNGYWLPVSERVTKFGRFVRKTSLDEFLNFYSVFKGDMSIIGPRPLAAIYADRYSDRHFSRHAVRPGLECPLISPQATQLTTLPGWHEQFENDVWYVEHVSLWTDIRMMFALVGMVFDAKRRSQHAVSGQGDFIGYDENGHAFGANNVPEQYMKIIEERRKQA